MEKISSFCLCVSKILPAPFFLVDEFELRISRTLSPHIVHYLVRSCSKLAISAAPSPASFTFPEEWKDPGFSGPASVLELSSPWMSSATVLIAKWMIKSAAEHQHQLL